MKHLVWTTLLVASNVSFGSALALPRGLQVGDCQLQETTTLDRQSLGSEVNVCVKGRALYDIVLSQKGEKTVSEDLKLYTGTHLGSDHLVQVQVSRKNVQPFRSPGLTGFLQNRVDLLTYQVGNPAFNSLSVSVGKQRLPFGINIQSSEGFAQLGASEQFFGSPMTGATASIDDHQNLNMQVGVGFVSVTDARWRTTARLMYDFNTLSGARFFLSGRANHDGRRSWGIGLLSLNPQQALFNIELIRDQSTPDGLQDPYTQLLRISYLGPYQGRSRIFVSYDDVRFVSRLGLLGWEIKTIDHLRVRIALGYKKEETEGKSRRWYGMTGVAAEL